MSDDTTTNVEATTSLADDTPVVTPANDVPAEAPVPEMPMPETAPEAEKSL